MLFDTHCHLDTPRFDADREHVWERAQAAGVTRLLNPAYDLDSSARAVALAERTDGIVAAVGVHPTSTLAFDDATLDQLRTLAARPSVVAIGEIGLDNYWKDVPPDVQERAFIAQLALARALDMPVIVHSREAMPRTLDILEAEFAGRPLVLHSFAGDIPQLERALSSGFYIGISGPVTYPSAKQTRDVVRAVPLDRLVIETDSPYLSPQRHRGKRNEPAYVRLVAEKIADVRDMLLDDVARLTAENARRLFRS
jgi:TatD DNase family protein